MTRREPNGDFATDDARNDDAYGDETAYGVTGRALAHDADVGRDGVRSTPSRETRKVEFLNARATTCAIYWVDFDWKETHYVDLPPGMTTLMSTFATHSWVARDMASTHAIAMFTVRARQSPDETPTQRFVVVDAERVEAYAEAFDDDDDDAARDASGPAPAEPDVDEGTRGGEDERGEEGEAGNANPDGKKTRGGGGRLRGNRREGVVVFFFSGGFKQTQKRLFRDDRDDPIDEPVREILRLWSRFFFIELKELTKINTWR